MKTKTPEIKLRDAHPDELEDVSKVLLAAHREYKKFMPPDGWDWYRNDIIDVRSRTADCELIVAEVRKKIADTVTLYP